MIETKQSREKWEREHEEAKKQLRSTTLPGLLIKGTTGAKAEQSPKRDNNPPKLWDQCEKLSDPPAQSWYQKNKAKLKAKRKQYRLDTKKKFKKK